MDRLNGLAPPTDQRQPESVIQARGLTRYFGARCATVDEQPLGLEDALIAYVGRQGEKSLFLNSPGGAK